MRLIEMVRAARANGHKYCAVDKNQSAYSYKANYKPLCGTVAFSRESSMEYIGQYNLTCDWKDSLIDITKLKGIK